MSPTLNDYLNSFQPHVDFIKWLTIKLGFDASGLVTFMVFLIGAFLIVNVMALIGGLGTYADFDDNPEKEYLWRRYISDESLERNLFRSMDRIKLTYILMERTLNSLVAKKSNLLVNSFPFHNRFTLFGEKRMKVESKSTSTQIGLKGIKLDN